MEIRTFLHFGILVLSVLAVASCRKAEWAGNDVPRREVRFGVTAPQTRSSSIDDAAVRSLDVLVFRAADGRLDSHGRNDDEDNVHFVSANVTSGLDLMWYIVANAPEGAFDNIGNVDAFLLSRVLLDGAVEDGLFTMFSCGTISGSSETETVNAGLERHVSKVSLEKVVYSWPDAFSMSDEVVLGRIALVNVVGSCLWNGTADEDPVWYNKMTVDDSAGEMVLSMTVSEIGLPLEKDEPLITGSSLYAMPNGVVNNVDSANTPIWSPRRTRIAVEVFIGGVANWYPVTLPSMSRNTHYLIRTLTITGPGVQGPDFPLTRDDVQFSVEIVPWSDFEVPTMYDEN